MKNDFLKHRPGLRRFIRYIEIIVVLSLLGFSAIIYRELRTLRASPVVLPAYWFNVVSNAGKVQNVQARGSWSSKVASPDVMHTTAIECFKARMQCMESSAVVAVTDGRYLESVQTIFDIDTWTDAEIRTKADVQPCSSRTLTLDIANRQAKSVVANKAGGASCNGNAGEEQTFSLVAGFLVNAEASKNSK